jgi:hypothetical protein
MLGPCGAARQVEVSVVENRRAVMKRFEGISRVASIQGALEEAVQAALGTISHTDGMVSYTVVQIGGCRGGIAGFKEVTVAIEVEVS